MPKLKISNRIKIGAIVILVIVFFVFFNLTGPTKEIKNAFYLASAPFQKFLWQRGLKISDFFETLAKVKNLKKENEALKSESLQLLSQVVELKELQNENKILREALDFGLKKEFKLILAEIISKDPSFDSVLVKAGSKDGVKEKMPVITSQKIILGYVSQVLDNYSLVQLITNQESAFDAKVQSTENKGDIYGLSQGKGNLELLLDLLPKDKEIKEGEIVVTTSLGGLFPPGLLVGKIKEIIKSDTKPFWQAKIEPAFNINELAKVFIIIDY